MMWSLDKILSNVDRSGDCCFWLGYLNHNGRPSGTGDCPGELAPKRIAGSQKCFGKRVQKRASIYTREHVRAPGWARAPMPSVSTSERDPSSSPRAGVRFMNRLIIKTASPLGCVVCGDLRQIRVDASDYSIIGVYPCPACVGPRPSLT